MGEEEGGRDGSADLLKMCFDLIVSVKLLLGRFHMRTMQWCVNGELRGQARQGGQLGLNGEGGG